MSEAPAATTVTTQKETELKKLIREQEEDDRAFQAPERSRDHAHLRTLRLDEGLPSSSYTEPGFEDIEERLSADAPRPISHTEAQRNAVLGVVAELSFFEQEVYYHIYGQGLSERETAHEMRDNDTKIHRTIVRIKERVAQALAALEDANREESG